MLALLAVRRKSPRLNRSELKPNRQQPVYNSDRTRPAPHRQTAVVARTPMSNTMPPNYDPHDRPQRNAPAVPPRPAPPLD